MAQICLGVKLIELSQKEKEKDKEGWYLMVREGSAVI